MEVHHKDPLFTALIGLLCGTVIGSGFMGYLQPLCAAISGEKAADWFSGAGTWVVGIAATALTFQQHRSITNRDKLNKLQLENEATAARERLDLDRRIRDDQNFREAMGDWNHYRTSLARLVSTYPLLVHSLKDLSSLPSTDAFNFARGVKSAIPSAALPHNKFFVDAEHMGDIAGLEIAVAFLKDTCEEFLSSPSPGASTESNILSDAEKHKYKNMADAALAVMTQAIKISDVVDGLRPSPAESD